MKYLKTYDNVSNSKMYWLLPTDERYIESLRKINFEERLIEFFLENNQDKYIYISYNSKYIPMGDSPWSWMPLFDKSNNIYGYEYYDSNNYTFLGYINMTPEEIEQFELEKNTNKYNL